VREAARLINDLDQAPPWMAKVRTRLHAVLAAETGIPADAKRWAAALMSDDSGHVQGWDRLEAARAVGLAALFDRDAAGAVESLGAVWEHTRREHVDDPGAFPVAPDLVEALVESGDVGSANDVAHRLRRLATRQQHPWGLASAKRCAAMVGLADGYSDEAAAALDEAAAANGELGLKFDRARTLLFLGRVQRRFKKRAGARHSLQAAEAQFQECGCSGWATRAQAELARVSGRRSGSEGDLTPGERQVVDLAAEGLSNNEIASRLFVTVSTVEAHLSRAYVKLGVRSRAQLGRVLADSP
jgi:DNA-binding NarL/FixJ family response regulator